MNTESKINTAKMLSLIDRMETNGTYNEGMMNKKTIMKKGRQLAKKIGAF